MSVPSTRLLSKVLRAATDTADAVELVLAAGGAAVGGADVNAYVNVVIQGSTVKVPRLSGAPIPAVGGPAYLLVSRDFILYLGTVKT